MKIKESSNTDISSHIGDRCKAELHLKSILSGSFECLFLGFSTAVTLKFQSKIGELFINNINEIRNSGKTYVVFTDDGEVTIKF